MLVMQDVSSFTDYGGYAVQETPSEPDYWVGNQLILRQKDVAATDAIAQFRKHFPDKNHVAIVWDMPHLAADQIDPDFVAQGCDVDLFDVLTLQGDIADAPMPGGITLRPLRNMADWAKSLELQQSIGIEEGYDADRHLPYLKRRNATRRDQIAKGLGQWFGAFENELLVAQMGMFHDDRIARYQSVETRASHRRQGICAALLRHCCIWALNRAPDATPVIVAEADSNAGRLYRRMGFQQAESLVGVIRPAY